MLAVLPKRTVWSPTTSSSHGPLCGPVVHVIRSVGSYGSFTQKADELAMLKMTLTGRESVVASCSIRAV